MRAAADLIDAGKIQGGLFQIMRLADDGSQDAKILLAHLYETGTFGAKRDIGRALAIYNELLEQKDPVAVLRLGQLYFLGENIRQDYNLAFYYYSILANAGDARAQFVVGDMYLRGLHTNSEPGTAKRWFESAADKGHLYAAKNVAALEFQDRPTFTGLVRLAYLSCKAFLMRTVMPNSTRVELI